MDNKLFMRMLNHCTAPTDLLPQIARLSDALIGRASEMNLSQCKQIMQMITEREAHYLEERRKKLLETLRAGERRIEQIKAVQRDR